MFADFVQTPKVDLSFALRFLSVTCVTIHRIVRQACMVEEFDNQVRAETRVLDRPGILFVSPQWRNFCIVEPEMTCFRQKCRILFYDIRGLRRRPR